MCIRQIVTYAAVELKGEQRFTNHDANIGAAVAVGEKARLRTKWH